MGGPNSGRRPDPVKQLIGINKPQLKTGNNFYLPNLAGIRKEARKNANSEELATKEYVDSIFIGTNFDFYAYDDNSDIPTYKEFKLTPSSGAEVEGNVSVLGNATGQMVGARITEDTINIPELMTSLQAGIWQFHVHMRAATANRLKFFAELYVRSALGVETLISTTIPTDFISTTDYGYEAHGEIITSLALETGDRIVVKGYATNASPAATTLYIAVEGDTASRVTLPGLSSPAHHEGLINLTYETAGHTGFASQEGMTALSGAHYSLSGAYDSHAADTTIHYVNPGFLTSGAQVDHDDLVNTHNLTTDIDHDQLLNYVANKHIDWTNTSEDFNTTGEAVVGSNLDVTGYGIFRGASNWIGYGSYASNLYISGATTAEGDFDVLSSGAATILHVDNTLGYVGIGTDAPLWPLYIYSPTTETTNLGAKILKEVDNSATNQQGLLCDLRIYNTATSARQYYALNAPVNWYSDEDCTASDRGVIGGLYAVRLRGEGTIGIARGVTASVENKDANGTITNAYGFYVEDGLNDGAVTNRYGLYLETQDKATNHWGIYQAGTTDDNYFSSWLTLANHAAPATPTASGRIFVSGGELWFIGSSGTQTQIAVA